MGKTGFNDKRDGLRGADATRANRVKTGAGTRAKVTERTMKSSTANRQGGVQEGGVKKLNSKTPAYKAVHKKKPKNFNANSTKDWKDAFAHEFGVIKNGLGTAKDETKGWAMDLPSTAVDGFMSFENMKSGRDRDGDPFIQFLHDGKVVDASNAHSFLDSAEDIAASASDGSTLMGLGGIAKRLAPAAGRGVAGAFDNVAGAYGKRMHVPDHYIQKPAQSSMTSVAESLAPQTARVYTGPASQVGSVRGVPTYGVQSQANDLANALRAWQMGG